MDLETLLQTLLRENPAPYRPDVEYLNAHYDEILAQYPDMWVGITGDGVVAASYDSFDLMAQLKAMGPAGEGALRRYMDTEPKYLIPIYLIPECLIPDYRPPDAR